MTENSTIPKRKPCSDFSCSPSCHHKTKVRYSSVSEASIQRPKIRKNRSNIVILSDDDFEDSDSDSSSVKDYTVVVKCAQINVYVDKEKQEISPETKCDETMQSKNSEPENAGTLPANSARISGKASSSFSRMKVVFPKTDASWGSTKRHLKHVDDYEGEMDKSSKSKRLAKPADGSRTASSSDDSEDDETNESSGSSSPEPDCSSDSSSTHRQIPRAPEDQRYP